MHNTTAHKGRSSHSRSMPILKQGYQLQGVAMKNEKVIMVELWGLGDAVLATSALQVLLQQGCKVTFVCKEGSKQLLEPSYPDVQYCTFHAPWCVFKGKYRLWRWPWKSMASLVRELHELKSDALLSARPDPREHLLFCTTARRRVGIPRCGSSAFLTECVRRSSSPQHRVNDWLDTVETWLPGVDLSNFAPRLSGNAYGSPHPALLSTTQDRRPLLILHCGAGIACRRWPITSLAQLLKRVRSTYNCSIALIPDLDGYGRELSELADAVLDNMTIETLVASINEADAYIGNDTGPTHIAAATGTPTFAIFGPTVPSLFAPFGNHAIVVQRDICRHKPCKDYCRFEEAICLTELSVEEVFNAVPKHFDDVLSRK